MIIGLKRGVVELADHDPEWEKLAAQTIERLWRVFGSTAKDIQHVGSTAITSIKAKPIIDIAVAVEDFSLIEPLVPEIKKAGFIYRSDVDDDWQKYIVLNHTDSDIRISNIHIVEAGGEAWHDYLLFRDYLNIDLASAKEYEAVKLGLMENFKHDRIAYCDGKTECCTKLLQLARIWANFDKRFTKIEPINKGWSEDKKYCVTMADGTKYLFRITPIERYEVRKSLFEMLKQVDSLGIPMCKPIEFGTCDDGVYSIQSWIDGEDLETVLPLLSETEQYVLGLKSGEIVRKMHSIPAPETQEEWETRFNRKTDYKIQKYHECGLRFEGDEHVLAYIEQNRHLLKNRPQCFQHGDYHIGNMMLENGKLKIIDFDRYDFGDPWEEFNRIVWSAAASSYFATGQLRGYFGGEPPLEFFKLLAFYIASNTLSSIYWAVPFGQSDLDIMMKQAQDVLEWFDNMNNPVPTWYLKDFYIQWIDGIPYKLKAPFDFSFLSKYGKVFKVYDNQGSGNICFGVVDSDKRYFVKFAGAPTESYTGTAENAIERLKRAVPAYLDLEHPNLIKLIGDENIGGGYAVVFDWVNALYMCASDGNQKFRNLPLKTHLKIFDEILGFHENMAKKGYCALDLYEDHIMWDVDNEKAIICDIDFYSKGWYEGMSGIWNTDCEWYFPEQFIDGAKFDEVSCVYIMGAVAFALFGDGRDRCVEKWKLNKELFDVAKKAVSVERDERQQSIEQLITEWRAAK